MCASVARQRVKQSKNRNEQHEGSPCFYLIMLFDTVAEGEVAVEEEQVLTWSSSPEPQTSPPRWHPRYLTPLGLCCFVFETAESNGPHSLDRQSKQSRRPGRAAPWLAHRHRAAHAGAPESPVSKHGRTGKRRRLCGLFCLPGR